MAVAVKAQTIPNAPTKIARATISQIKNSWATLTTKQGNEGFTVNPKVQTSKNHKIST